MEDVRLALENCLQDHSYTHKVTVRGDLFIIEPMTDEECRVMTSILITIVDDLVGKVDYEKRR